MSRRTKLLCTVLVLSAALMANTAWARSSDRGQPMDIDAGHSEGGLDDRAPTVLSGGVIITQGTLDVRSATATVSRNNGDLSRAVLVGSPTVLKQLMDDGTPMTARASKVDYDLKSEIVIFTGNVKIEQPRGNMSGEHIVYNMKTGRVESGGAGNGRVKMRINPKSPATAPAPSTAKPTPAKPAGTP
ncbi:MAG: lipopolysaccharide transport periplasmic protein LptA [Luteimonas sp.]